MEAKTSNLRSLLERNDDRRVAETSDADDDHEYSAFANGRISARPQVSITFVKADGAALAVAYSHLYSVTSDNPAEGFAIKFTDTKVTLTGRNLASLFRLICQHRVAEVREGARNALMELPADAVRIEAIAFE